MLKKRRWLRFCLAACLCVLFCLPVQGESMEDNTGESQYQSQAYGMAIYEKYLQSILPDYGGDVYFDGNTLVVCVTDEAHIASLQAEIPKNAVDSGIVRFEVQTYSSAQLMAAQDFLNDYMKDYCIAMTALCTSGNYLEICTRDDSLRPEILKLLQLRGYTEDMFRFTHCEPVQPVTENDYVYEMKPEDYAVSFAASPRTYVILVGTAMVLIVEYSVFGWLEWRENARYRRKIR